MAKQMLQLKSKVRLFGIPSHSREIRLCCIQAGLRPMHTDATPAVYAESTNWYVTCTRRSILLDLFRLTMTTTWAGNVTSTEIDDSCRPSGRYARCSKGGKTDLFPLELTSSKLRITLHGRCEACGKSEQSTNCLSRMHTPYSVHMETYRSY